MKPWERRIDNALANGGEQRMEQAMARLPSIMRNPILSGRQKVIMLRKVADELGAVMAPHTICRKGCSYCCHQHILISELEARVIEEQTGRQRAPVQRLVTSKAFEAYTDAAQHKYLGVPCTFLGDDGACTIYEHRPIKCRSHYTLADDVELCNTNRGLTVRDLPLYENPALEMATAQLIAPTTLADIREFFPKEEE